MTNCRLCRAQHLETLIDLGRQPVSSHFTRQPNELVVEHPLRLMLCACCGLVQLDRAFPWRDLVSPHGGISYREPEEHLDQVVSKSLALADPARPIRVLGVSTKDRSTLSRVARLTNTDVHEFDPNRDLHASNPNAGIETVQALLTPSTAEQFLSHDRPADIVIARHILEHSDDPQRFLAALTALLAPDGIIVLEVPDCEANLHRQDYAMIWEEHVAYFTHSTFAHISETAGLAALDMDRFAYPFEDVLVLYARKVPFGPAHEPSQASIAGSLQLARDYGAAFVDLTERLDGVFQRLSAHGRGIAAYGAGHLTQAVLNFHRLAGHVSCVVDDTADKQGLYLPRSGLPIVSRECLETKQIGTCLTGFGPQAEEKVIANNQAFVDAGGHFYSLLADSPRSLRILH